MIAEDKVVDALFALHAILVQMRMMAAERAPHAELVKALDLAELLPMLMVEKAEATDEFRR